MLESLREFRGKPFHHLRSFYFILPGGSIENSKLDILGINTTNYDTVQRHDTTVQSSEFFMFHPVAAKIHKATNMFFVSLAWKPHTKCLWTSRNPWLLKLENKIPRSCWHHISDWRQFSTSKTKPVPYTTVCEPDNPICRSM